MSGPRSSSSNRLTRLAQDSGKVPRVSVKFARPLVAPTQNLRNIASAIFCGPKQVIRVAQIQEVEKPVLPLDGIAEKRDCGHFWILLQPPV